MGASIKRIQVYSISIIYVTNIAVIVYIVGIDASIGSKLQIWSKFREQKYRSFMEFGRIDFSYGHFF